MADSIHFLNGKFVIEDQLVISARDVGFSRGYAVFDFLRTYHQKPFKLSRNIDRLFNSADLIGLQIPWTKEQITQWVYQTLEKNKDGGEKTIKIIISGGVSDSMLPGEPTIIIIVDPRHIYPDELYEKGTKAISVKFNRYIPLAKSNNYIEGVKQTQIAKISGAIEPIYYNETQVFEGSNSNVFTVINNRLLTPKSNILGGITRETLLEILKLEIPLEEMDFSLEDLLNATEVFMTSSNRGITPIVEIDGKKIGHGNVGPITKEVIKQFSDYTNSNKWL